MRLLHGRRRTKIDVKELEITTIMVCEVCAIWTVCEIASRVYAAARGQSSCCVVDAWLLYYLGRNPNCSGVNCLEILAQCWLHVTKLSVPDTNISTSLFEPSTSIVISCMRNCSIHVAHDPALKIKKILLIGLIINRIIVVLLWGA